MDQVQGYMKSDGEVILELRQRLREAEETLKMLDALVENSTDAIQISDKNLVTLRVNRAYEILTGIKREELVGVPVAELVEKHLISESCGAIVAQTGKPHTIVQTFYRTGRSAHVSCSPVQNRNGEIEYFICNDRDLDEISNLQSELDKVKTLNDRYLSELGTLKSQLSSSGEMIAEDGAMLKVLALANRIAKVDSTALILGETGVGKDETARFIHQNSNRAGQKFVTINCGAIAESLFESELFGHEGYAFTGSGTKTRLGLLEVAEHGTLFLDEIGELSLNMQTKLLHVLQNHTITRVGGTKPILIDVRIIAATNCDLEEMVREKKFREDLFYRLNVVTIRIPPLRERKNDIIPLAQHFLEHYNSKYHLRKRLSPTACFALLNCDWIGNVRQLKNTIEQAVIMCDNDTILPEYLPIQCREQGGLLPCDLSDQGLDELLEQTERQYLNLYYDKYGSVRKAAQQLKIPPTTFLRHRNHLNAKYGDRASSGDRGGASV